MNDDDLGPNLCRDVSGHVALTVDAHERIWAENIRRGKEYKAKLESGAIKPYKWIDVRPGGGIRKSRKRTEAKTNARHIPARDHVQARLAKDKSATVGCYG